MPPHRSSAYLAAGSRFRLRRPLFRTVRLNAVGWAAVGGLCAAGAGVGLAAARALSRDRRRVARVFRRIGLPLPRSGP